MDVVMLELQLVVVGGGGDDGGGDVAGGVGGSSGGGWRWRRVEMVVAAGGDGSGGADDVAGGVGGSEWRWWWRVEAAGGGGGSSTMARVCQSNLQSRGGVAVEEVLATLLMRDSGVGESPMKNSAAGLLLACKHKRYKIILLESLLAGHNHFHE